MAELHLGDDAVLTVDAMYGQYRIEADPEQDEDWPAPPDALATGEDGWIAVLTGTQHGPVSIRFQYLATAPDSLASDWDMVGERDLHCAGETIRIRDLLTDRPPHYITVAPGIYRVRLHVVGRSAAQPFPVVSEPIERHLIQMWAVPEPSGPAVLVGPDDWGRGYLEQVAELNRRPTDSI